MRDSVRWRKQSRIILMLAERLQIAPDKAMEVFYNSRTYNFFSDSRYGLQAMSDEYVVEEIIMEYAKSE